MAQGEQTTPNVQTLLEELERKERLLHDMEARQRAFLNALPGPMFRVNRDGICLDASIPDDWPSGKPQYEFIGRPFSDTTPADVYEAHMVYVRKALETGEILRHEYQLVGSRGLRHYEARIVASGPDEAVIHVRDRTERKQIEENLRQSALENARLFEAAQREIEERKRTEEALRQSQTRESLLINNNALAVVEWSLDFRMVGWNLAAEKMFGYTKAEILGYGFIDLIVPPEARTHVQEVQETLNTGVDVVHSINQNVTKDGRIITCEWYNVPLVDADGNNLGYAAMALDITERVQAEEALRQSEERFRLAMDSSPEAIVTYDTEGRATYVNPVFIRTLGWSWDELIGRRIPFVPEGHEHEVIDALNRLYAGEKSVAIETKRLTNDGRELDVRLSASLFRDARGNPTGLIVVLQDISQRKRVEEELRQAKEEAEGASRAKSAFIAHMSHELRTPLNAILGFAQLMERDPVLTSSQRENLKVISRSGEHLLSLINDVLEMSKIEAGKATLSPSNFDLHRLLENLETMLRIRADGKGLELAFELEPGLPRFIRTDSGKLRQVLINLVGNAIKFTDTGRVNLRARSTEVDGASIRLWFEIEDTGQGIDPAELNTIFETFVQTSSGKESHEGTGLGLAISRQFVNLMGGTISARSERHKGSTFSFDIHAETVLPIEGADVPAPRRVVGLEPGQPAYRILVVEDHRESRELLLQLLRSVGLVVREATNGLEAIELTRSWRPQLIFMDMRMPVMDGYEATRTIKADPELQSTVVIAVTASAFDHERSSTLAVGCNDFITKPYREALIFSKLGEFLGARFVYELTGQNPAQNRTSAQMLSPAALRSLPPDLLSQLSQAAEEINGRMVKEVTDSIRAEKPEVADMLDSLVASYRFDRLQILVKLAMKKTW